MDKNQVTGLILISLLLFAYYYFLAPKSVPEQSAESPVEVIQDNEKIIPQEKELKDSVALSIPEIDTAAYDHSGPFNTVLKGEEREIIIENDLVRYTFSTRGASIKRILLKKFLTYYKEPLVLLDENSSKISQVINTTYGQFDINELYFETVQSDEVITQDDTLDLSFTAQLANGDKIIKSFRIPGDAYTISEHISFGEIRGELESNTILFSWRNNLKEFEKDLKTSQIKSTINYYTVADGFDNLRASSSDFQDETINQQIDWISFNQKFFTAAVLSNNSFTNAYLSTDPVNIDTNTVKACVIKSEIPIENFEEGHDYYFGPNNYQILKKVSDGFAKNIYLGWTPVNWVNKFLIIPTFHFLERFISNYGIIIILLVLFIKILLFPLTYKSYISMAKTKVLKPELDAIKEQFGGDMQKVQSEQMKLYQQVGVNPLSGCVPILLQMPILFSMFYFFPNSIELRQESFLWADDLSTFDSVLNLPFTIPAYGSHVSLFTLLMTASTILYTWSNNQVSTVQGPMKSMQYFMPVIFMFVLNSFPAALSFYYFVSNVITFGQQALIRKFVDEEKIKKILDENRLKSTVKKKSRFQMKLEEAMKSSDDVKKKKKR
jgi:YidC/Oxa1 family membrane protein insertase